MPYPNEHSARVRDPNEFRKDAMILDDGSRTTFARKVIGDGISIIVGKLKDAPKDKRDSTYIQAYRFNKKKFSAEEVKKWLKDHDIEYKEFEPAREK